MIDMYGIDQTTQWLNALPNKGGKDDRLA
jgi:hypothetical protein